MISSEGPPMTRATSLVDVLEGLPRELRARDHEVACTLPFYREIRENPAVVARDTGITVDVRVGTTKHVAEYLEGRSASGVQMFFVRCDEFFDRPGVYGERGEAYEDNATRFIFLSKAAVELARRLTPAPQILHAHDWAPALVPVLVKEQQLPFATVLTIHHLAEQGSFWGLDFSLTNLPERYFSLRGVEFFGRLNLLKGGILFRRPDHDRKRALFAGNGEARVRLRPGACAARKCAQDRRDSKWRRLRQVESGNGSSLAGSF